MIWNYRAWRRKRLLKSAMLPVREWQQVLEALPVLHGLDASQTERLGQLTWLFLYEKAIHGVQGMEVTDAMRLRIAAQACLMILELDLDCYSGFQTVLVYPAGFRVRHEYEDEAGVVHTQVAELSGEAWERGPVILSADDVMAESNNDGVNLVIHEFAHKLDMLSGVANGLPPLHPGMDPNAWAQAFQNAYRDLCGRVDAGEALPIDEYATENPAECFAVFCEAFFEIPQILALAYPAVYRQLTLFYRQDPLRRQ